MENNINLIIEEIHRLYHENEGNGYEEGDEASYIAGYTNACEDIKKFIKKIWK